MSPQGDDRPPRRSGGSEGGGKPEEPKKPGGSGGSGEGGGGKKPEYTVYGRRRPERARSGPLPRGKKPGEQAGEAAYRVYRSRPEPARPDPQAEPRRACAAATAGGRLARPAARGWSGGKRPWLRWVLIVAVGWLLLSFITFAISAQIQKGKLPQSAKDALKGGPAVLAGQNILILGGDRRGKTQHNASGSEGQGPPRADTIMVLHASLTSFHKLSIPRDSYAAIPDCGEQKINASLACNTNSTNGNPASTIKTVENFLGIDINHIVIVNFDGFADFINTLGGVTIDVPGNPDKKGAVVCGDVDGGKKQGGVSLKLPPGRGHAAGRQGARLRPAPPQQLRPVRGRPRPGRPPAAGPQRDQGPPDQHHPLPLQLHQGPLHRLGRAEGVHQRHGRLHPAAGRDRGDPRRQRRDQRARRQQGRHLLRARRQPRRSRRASAWTRSRS